MDEHLWQSSVFIGLHMKKSFYQYCMETGQWDLLAQWNQKMNGNLTPARFSWLSVKKEWWKCSKGHEWTAQIKLRLSEQSCPICESENASLLVYPSMAENGNSVKGRTQLSVNQMAELPENAWWCCKYGHEWQADILPRTTGKGCPICAGKTTGQIYKKML